MSSTSTLLSCLEERKRALSMFRFSPMMIKRYHTACHFHTTHGTLSGVMATSGIISTDTLVILGEHVQPKSECSTRDTKSDWPYVCSEYGNFKHPLLQKSFYQAPYICCVYWERSTIIFATETLERGMACSKLFHNYFEDCTEQSCNKITWRSVATAVLGKRGGLKPPKGKRLFRDSQFHQDGKSVAPHGGRLCGSTTLQRTRSSISCTPWLDDEGRTVERCKGTRFLHDVSMAPSYMESRDFNL